MTSDQRDTGGGGARRRTSAPMTDTKPPRVGADEKATLLGFLDYLRSAVVGKAAGVPEPQGRTPGVDSGTSVLGLVKHLTVVERFYFLGENPADWAAGMRPAPDESAEQLIAGYREAVEQANRVIEACHDLTLPIPHPPRPASVPTMRWVLVHMIEETGRHAGHLDILREQIDGSVGR